MDCFCQAAALVLFCFFFTPIPTGLFHVSSKGGDIYAYGLIILLPLRLFPGTYTERTLRISFLRQLIYTTG